MCGIYLGTEEPSEYVLSALQRRGPDNQQSLAINNFHLRSTVLHMRGPSVTAQPVTSKSARFVLQWNGEIFGFTQGANCDGLWDRSDTAMLFERLVLCTGERDVVDLLLSIEGPFAVVILDTLERVVYFGRDRFGRRSLIKKPTGLWLCSVTDSVGEFEEVSAEGIHRCHLDNGQYGLFHYSKITQICDTVHGNDVVDYTALFMEVMKVAVRKRLVHVEETVTVLFSGGVDSLLIAAVVCLVAAESVAVELVNVAFASDPHGFDAVPDRQTGILAYNELKGIFAHRNIRFIPKNVHIHEYQEHRAYVTALMRPNGSVMDESIGMAIWFAARGSPSRVLMVGMGADEQFGGYTRHAVRLRRDGYEGLLAELQLDVDRIASRNLGRDDRVISDHSVEARYPFLDEQVVLFSGQLPLDQKMMQRAGGENKWIVRESLRRLGFTPSTAATTKRAIQFGARTAKLQQALLEGGAPP